MTQVYFAGNEDSHFVPVNATIQYQNFSAGLIYLRSFDGLRSRSNYPNAPTRYACSVISTNWPGSPTVANWNPYLRCPFWTQPSAGFWFGARVWQSMDYYAVRQSPLWRGLSPDGVARLLVMGTGGGNSGAYAVYTANAAGTLTMLCVGGATSGGFAGGTVEKLDVHVDYSTNGLVELYINRLLHCSFSGDVTTEGATQISAVDLGSFCYNNSDETTWSEVVCLDSDTRDVTVYSRVPTGPGDTTQWTGDYTSVSGPFGDTLTSSATSAAGQLMLYVTGATKIDIGQEVVAVVDPVFATQGPAVPAGTPTHFAAARKVNGAVYLGPSNQFPPILTTVPTVWATNPATGAAWTPADLNASTYQIGLQSAA
jgi:hypothetical protein